MFNGKAFGELSPDRILSVLEGSGFACDGRLLALNSYENRVYQVGIHEAEPVVAKFYRPGRWSSDAILEEHKFTKELYDSEVPVVPPITVRSGGTLIEQDGFRVSVYPRHGGRDPNFENKENLRIMGRNLARLHTVGSAGGFEHRENIDPVTLGHNSVSFVEQYCVPLELRQAYKTLANDLLTVIDASWTIASELRTIRLHGDCHAGNILWRNNLPNFVDFDDSRTGPAVQDLWMLLSGTVEEQRSQMSTILEGYADFAAFDFRELTLLQPLRALRMLHYAAWLGRRQEDPAFLKGFPWFYSHTYWENHILDLREQFADMQEQFIL